MLPPLPLTMTDPAAVACSNASAIISMPSKSPVVGTNCWFASTVRFPLAVVTLDKLLSTTFELTFIVAIPVPAQTIFAFAATMNLSTPGDASSFCRSALNAAPEIKLMSPFMLTTSLPIPPLMVKPGRLEVKAPTWMVSLPVPALMTIKLNPAITTSIGSAVVAPEFNE